MRTLLRAGSLIILGMLIVGIIGGCGDNRMDPPQSEDDVGPPATEVVMDPPPHSTDGVVYYIPPNIEFTLTFNEGVIAVTVNDTPASGSGINWTWSA